MNREVLFATGKDDWGTPPEVFNPLHEEFDFGLDVAASADNAKCPDYLGLDRDDPRFRDALACSWRDALDFTWGDWHRPVWMNPPYSRRVQHKFVAKAAAERLAGVTTVALLPARTDTKSFHAHIWDRTKHRPREGVEIRFLKGRVRFVGAPAGAPFPSMVVVFRPTTINEHLAANGNPIDGYPLQMA